MRKTAIVLVIVGALLFAFTAATAIAAPPADKGQGKGKEKIAVCHKGKKTLTVAAPAAKGHTKHGDTLGACGGTTGGTTGGATEETTAEETTTP